jgi:uncharacterized protein (DUF885 family)
VPVSKPVAPAAPAHRVALLLVLFAMPCGAATSAHDGLQQLAQEVTYTTAALFPMRATAEGIAGHDAQLGTASEAARAAYLAQLLQWQQRLTALRQGMAETTPLVDRDDARLLSAQLTAELNALQVYQTDRKDYGGAANQVVGAVYTQVQHLPVIGQEGATRADRDRGWADITLRLAAAPAYIEAAQRLVTMPCHLYGLIAARRLAGAPDFLKGALSDAAAAQLGPHSRALARFLKARDATLTAIAATRAYIDAHVAAWPENYAMGREAYDRMLMDEQLLPLNADDIERMGRDELAHGWAEEAWLTSLAQRAGVALGAPSGGGLAPGGAALVGYYRDRIAELTRFVVDHDVVTVPAWLGSMTVVETPLFLQPVYPGASMNPPRLFENSTTGFYYITPPKSLDEAAARLDMNEDFDSDRILSTAAHEAMPGHLLQLSIARRHPDFIRKVQSSAVFEEGWAFYGEEMFVRLGLYGDHLDGRLFTARWERVRGARAIVDPKLASGEWSYEQAVDFYATQGGFTREAAAAAVAAIATNPGYYFAYTAGRWQIEMLYGDYIQKLGVHGSLHDFHDRLLSYGSTPLSIVGPELLADLDKSAAQVRAAANY